MTRDKRQAAGDNRVTEADPRKAATTNGGESIAGYFRNVFKENPKLLKERSNDELYRRWLADHPGHAEVPPNVKVGLQNIKGVLRQKLRDRKAAKRAAAGGQGKKLPAAPATRAPKPYLRPN